MVLGDRLWLFPNNGNFHPPGSSQQAHPQMGGQLPPGTFSHAQSQPNQHHLMDFPHEHRHQIGGFHPDRFINNQLSPLTQNQGQTVGGRRQSPNL